MADPLQVLSRFLFDQALRLDGGSLSDADIPDWAPETRLTAVVRAVGDTSRALLQIGSHVVDAKLPIDAKVGDQLKLRVVEAHPRLVFALEHAPEPATHTQVSLSSGARILGDLVPKSTASAGQPLPLPLATALPEATAGTNHAEQITRTLTQNLRASGLFYERHQARWVAGDFPLEELKKEPQSQQKFTASAPPAAPGRAGPTALVETVRESLPQTIGLTKEPAARTSSDTLNATPEAPLRGQLDMLEGRALTVALPGWAQRDFHWQLPQRENQASDGHIEAAWSTQLRVHFPNLGSVCAHIRLSSQGLAVQVQADGNDSAHQLASRQDELLASLQAAGLPVTHLTIARSNG